MSSDFTIKELDSSQIIKISEIKSSTLGIADKILEGYFYFFGTLDLVDFTKGINWDYQHSKNSPTYQLYLQALNPISFLLNAFELSNEIKYLLKAFEVTESWIDYSQSEPSNSMVWYDHPTAYRAHNLVYFLIIAKRHLNIDEEKYVAMIKKHVNYLYKDDNYRKNNHGIMMDRALVMLGLVCDHDDANRWIEKGIWRLTDTFYSSYSQKGVHLENSPEYHRIVRNLYLSTEKFLNKNNLSLGKELIDRIALSDKYFYYVTKPDGFLPMIGDSGKFHIGIDNKRYESFSDDVAGITILQSKNKIDEKLSTWLSFVCGYGTTTHKHYDDLSLNLYYNGNDIFVDPGKYSYGKSKIRSYVISPHAHNSIMVENERYKFDNNTEDHKYIRTSSFFTSQKLDIVKGFNMGYEGVVLERIVTFLKPNIVIIVDIITSEKTKNIMQVFNLAAHIEIINNSEQRLLLNSKQDLVEIEQYNHIDSIQIYDGEIDPPKAIIAEKFGDIIETKQLVFSKEVTNGSYITAIKLGEEAIGDLKRVSFNQETRKLEITYKDEEIKLYV